MDEDELVQQLGLLLTQVRVSRMALENIERSTGRFAGLALAASAAPDRPAFGAPPMVDGALKVYVVNVDDLVAAAPGGGILETLLGGVGRLVGGLVGGIAGGVLGGITVPYVVDRLAATVRSVERIVDRLLTTMGLSQADWRVVLGLRPDASERVPAPPPEPPSPLTAGLGDMLGRLAPEQVVVIVQALTRVVDALVLLVPLAVGAVATLVSTVGDLRLEIVEWIGFALRNLLLLRAVAVAVLSDVAGLVAPVAATVLTAVARIADAVLSGVGALLARVVVAAFSSARILAGGLTASINAAVDFLTGTVLPLLNYFQQTTVFRLFAWFVTAVPAMLTALAAAAGRPVSATESASLTGLSAAGVALLGAPVPPAPTTTRLTATSILAALGPGEIAALDAELQAIGATARTATAGSLSAARSAVTDTADALRDAAVRSTTSLSGVLDDQLRVARGHITELDAVQRDAEAAAARRPETTIDRIAESYRGWLTGGGMQLLLGEITRHFATTPPEGEAAARSVPGRVLAGVADAQGRHDVVVEVGEVVIELAAPAGAAGAGASVAPDPAALLVAVRDVEARGGTLDDLVPVGVV